MPIFPSLFDVLGRSSLTSSILEMDWKETTKSHVFKIDVPGFTKDQIKIHLQDGRVLEISVERNEEEFVKGDEKWHCKERINTGGKFSRRFRLPENVKKTKNLDDEIKATLEDGVLTITVPKDDDDDDDDDDDQGADKKWDNKIRAVEISGGDDDDDRRSGSSKVGLSRLLYCCKA